MLIYNVTANVDERIHQSWLEWMESIHIPEVLQTGKFKKALLTRVLVDEELGGITYSIQYTADSKADLESYYSHDAVVLRKKVVDQFGEGVVAFRTELQIIKEFTSDNAQP